MQCLEANLTHPNDLLYWRSSVNLQASIAECHHLACSLYNFTIILFECASLAPYLHHNSVKVVLSWRPHTLVAHNLTTLSYLPQVLLLLPHKHALLQDTRLPKQCLFYTWDAFQQRSLYTKCCLRRQCSTSTPKQLRRMVGCVPHTYYLLWLPPNIMCLTCLSNEPSPPLHQLHMVIPTPYLSQRLKNHKTQCCCLPTHHPTRIKHTHYTPHTH